MTITAIGQSGEGNRGDSVDTVALGNKPQRLAGGSGRFFSPIPVGQMIKKGRYVLSVADSADSINSTDGERYISPTK